MRRERKRKPGSQDLLDNELLMQQHAAIHPAQASPAALLSLQGAYGNQAVQRLIQAKLTVGAAHDPYEREADRIAAAVAAHPSPAFPVGRAPDDERMQRMPLPITPLAKRAAPPADFNNKLRRAGAPGKDLRGSFDAGPRVESKLAANTGGGSPLPEATRAALEPHFGKDFSSVRLHTGSEAALLNRQLGAKAFTNRNHIYLGEGASPGDKPLLAHELTHVVQQGGAGGQLQTKDRAGAVLQRKDELHKQAIDPAQKWDAKKKLELALRRMTGQMENLGATAGTLAEEMRGLMTTSTYEPANAAWESLIEAMHQFARSQGTLPPVAASDRLINDMKKNRKGKNKTRKTSRRRAAIHFAWATTKNIPLLGFLPRNIRSRVILKDRPMDDSLWGATRGVQELRSHYMGGVAGQVRDRVDATEFRDEVKKFANVLRSVGGDRTDMDNLEVIFQRVVSTRFDSRVID